MEMKYDLVVSLATYKERILNRNLSKVIDSILNQNTNAYFKIVLTVYKDDMQYFNVEQLNYLHSNKVEIIEAEQNLRPHLKYYYCFKKYHDFPIITIDDDAIYNEDLISTLIASYIEDRNCISACRCRHIKVKNDCIDKYNTFNVSTVKHISHLLLATGNGGILYPPNCINVNDLDLNEMHQCLTTDDVYLKYIELKNNIQIKNIAYQSIKQPILSDADNQCALYLHENIKNNDITIQKFITPLLDIINQPISEDIPFYICNCDTTILTNYCIKCIRRMHKQNKIYVFDNSTISKFINYGYENVDVIDNFSNKLQLKQKPVQLDYGSFNHEMTINYILEHTKHDEMLLIDSDALLVQPIDNVFCDRHYVTCGRKVCNFANAMPRIHPVLQYFNVSLMRQQKLKYSDGIHVRSEHDDNKRYDTGSWFFAQLNSTEYNDTNTTQKYIRHLEAMSYDSKYVCNRIYRIASIFGIINKNNKIAYINQFIQERNFKTYLEVGVRFGETFNNVKIQCKVSVDPDKNAVASYKITSDEFFDYNKNKFDIILIDGLHHAEQVYRDIKNSLACLNENGVIILHDCLPLLEIHQVRSDDPRKIKHWNGDVWKAFVKYRKESQYECYTIDADWGLGIIDTSKKKTTSTDEIPFKDNMLDYTWNEFYNNRDKLLNVVDDIKH